MELMEKYGWLKDQVKREGFAELMTWLETNTEYLKSPASYKYYGSHEGGLLEHSVSVAATMLRIKKVLAPEVSDEECVIVSLLSGCGRAGNTQMALYTENEPTTKQKQFGYKANPPYGVNDSITYMNPEMRSIYLIQSCPVRFQLSEEEISAIFMCEDPWQGQQSAYRKNKLMTLLQMANYYSILYLEEE